MAGTTTAPEQDNKLPLVSCLTITPATPDRLEFLKRSLNCYAAQTYHRRELVIVIDNSSENGGAAIREIARSCGNSDIRIVEPHGNLTLGALRNQAIRAARGDYLCTWDDDDMYHPERLARQAAALNDPHKTAVGLTEIIQFFPAERRLFLTNWVSSPPSVMPASLMWKRSVPAVYPETGDGAQLGEDLAFIAQLQPVGGVSGISGAPYLYVSVCHGHNTTGVDHQRMLTEKLAVSKGMVLRREPALRAGLAAYDFGPGSLTVEGNNGLAFTLSDEDQAGQQGDEH